MTRLILTLLFACAFHAIFALNASSITIERTTASFFNTDSNNPCNAGPKAAYVGFKVTNTSATTQTNLVITLSSFSPTTFALAGGQAASQTIGKLAPNSSDVLYWYVSYPCTHNTACNITAVVSDAAPGTKSFTTTITTKSSISANAGGLINTTLVGAGAIIGQIIPYTVTYSFGNGNNGDEYNMQPAGNLNFDASTFQLVNTEIISSVIPNITAGTKDKLYYIGGTKNGSGNLVTVRYFFEVKKSNSPGTTARPYAVQTSGTQIKYTGNYETAIINSMPITGTNPLTLTLSSNKVSAPACDTITYKVMINNPSSYATSTNEIKVQLPNNISYIGLATGSEVTESMLMSSPSTGSTGSLKWVGGKDAPVFPYKEFYIPANDSLVLLFKAVVSCLVPQNTATSANAIAYTGLDSTNLSSKSICLNCDANFPVEFGRFEARWEGDNEVRLIWETESEKNNDYFEVEHSIDGNAFAHIGQVKGAGNSSSLLQYEFQHTNAVSGINYYRIKQIDFDGKFQYSEVKKIATSFGDWMLVDIFPNPASELTTIQVQTKVNTNVRIQIYNLQGSMMGEWLIKSETDTKEIALNISPLKQGNYFVKITPLNNPSRTLTKILTVQ